MEHSIKEPHPQLTIGSITSDFLKQNKVFVVLYIALLCTSLTREIWVPHLFGELVQSIESKKSLWRPLVLLFGITFVVQIGTSLIQYAEVDIFPRFQAFVRDKIIRNIIQQNNENFSDIESSIIIAKLMRLPIELFSFINQWKYEFIPYFVLSIAVVIYLTYHNTTLGIGLAMLLIMLWCLIYASVFQCSKYSYTSEAEISKLSKQVDDVMRNMLSVLNSNQEANEMDKVKIYEEAYRKAVRKTLECSMKLRYLILPCNLAYFAFFIYMGYKLVKEKKLRAAVLVTLVIIIFRVFNSVWGLSGIINETVTRHGMLKESLHILQQNNHHSSHSKQTTNPPLPKSVPQTGLVLHHLSYAYPNSKPVLRDIHLHILPKQKVAFIGRNGCGKSTLLKLLLKLIQPTSGAIYYNGNNYQSIETSTLRNHIGFVAQQPILFNRTIYENITYGLNGVTKLDVQKLVSQLHLDNMFSKFQKGLDTEVGRNGSSISGGQRQIVCLLRILLQNPNILLLDEPSASIDSESKHYVHELLKKVMEDKMVILVTHDDQILKYADRIVRLGNGVVVQDNSINSINSNNSNNSKDFRMFSM